MKGQRVESRSKAAAVTDMSVVQEHTAEPHEANGGVTEPSGREWQTFTRQAPLELAEEGDGRTLYGRVVPYNVIATVSDPPHYREYQESFVPGAFRKQLQAANRIKILLNFEHRQSINDVVGTGVSLEDQADGLYGTFRFLDHSDGDKALELVNSGVLRGMSTEFKIGKTRTVEGVQQRVDARIGNVALCREFESNYAGPKAAYPGAEVLSIRTDIHIPEPAPVASDLQERLAALGVTPILIRAVTRKPWDGSPGRFTDDEYKRSCLICRGTDAPPKTDCSLPVLEPDGSLNLYALAAAAGRLGQTQGIDKAAVARKLVRLYRSADMEPPPRILQLAAA